jgi:hypothetical protein
VAYLCLVRPKTHVTQFIVFALTGFATVWINTFFWGFTAGPVNAIPYFALVGGLLLFIVVSAVALFLPRLGSLLALIACALIIPWPLFILVQEHDASGVAICGAPAIVVGAFAAFCFIRSRGQPLLGTRVSPHWALRLVIAVLPLLAFALCFNALLVLEVVVRYPFSR